MRASQAVRSHVLVERAGLGLLDPDTDQVAREIVAAPQRMQALAGRILGDDLALELDAVAAVSGIGILPQKARPRSIESRSICPTRGAHSTSSAYLHRARAEAQVAKNPNDCFDHAPSTLTSDTRERPKTDKLNGVLSVTG